MKYLIMAQSIDGPQYVAGRQVGSWINSRPHAYHFPTFAHATLALALLRAEPQFKSGDLNHGLFNPSIVTRTEVEVADLDRRRRALDLEQRIIEEADGDWDLEPDDPPYTAAELAAFDAEERAWSLANPPRYYPEPEELKQHV